MRIKILRSANANNDKFELLFNAMNKKYLPLMYSFVFCRVYIVLVDFRLHCVTTLTPFIRRSVTNDTYATRARAKMAS